MREKICVVYLVHGKGLEEFLENSLLSLRRSGCAMDVVVYASADMISSIAKIAARYHATVAGINNDESSGSAHYVPYGTHQFNTINLMKWELIIATLKLGYECVVYCDADIAFALDFGPYLINAIKHYSCGMQSESQNKFPPVYCAGFMFFTAGAMMLLEDLRKKGTSFAERGNDQDLLNREISEHPHLAKEILLLPEGQFQNGLYFQTAQPHGFAAMRGRLQPFIFHANFVVGLAAKRELLKLTGHWHLNSDSGHL